jgi:thiol-disulfide isomerase/thioredoxin
MKPPISTLAILACSLTTLTGRAQPGFPSLNIGDQAPPLQVQTWLKGDPVQQFEKGKVYVVEFWATWCRPCKAAMPHLSRLAAQYKDSVVFIGVDIYEDKNTSIDKIRRFVESMGDQLSYRVATEDSNRMETGWLDAAEEKDRGIPRSFVIDASGTVAWIGYPGQLGTVLPKVVNNTWNLSEALVKRNRDRYLRQLDDSLNYEFARYKTMDGKEKPGYSDSVLRLAKEYIGEEPRLKYAPQMAYTIFAALLRTSPLQALGYGRKLLGTTTYEDDPPYDAIIDVLRTFPDGDKIPAEIYQLGVEAYQDKIDHFPYPELLDLTAIHHTMADWDRRARANSVVIAGKKG